MTIELCDRCGKAMTDAYYTIDIYGHSINERGTTVDAASTNLRQTIEKTQNAQKRYCKECKDEIEKYINSKVVTVEKRYITNKEPIIKRILRK